ARLVELGPAQVKDRPCHRGELEAPPGEPEAWLHEAEVDGAQGDGRVLPADAKRGPLPRLVVGGAKGDEAEIPPGVGEVEADAGGLLDAGRLELVVRALGPEAAAVVLRERRSEIQGEAAVVDGLVAVPPARESARSGVRIGRGRRSEERRVGKEGGGR